MRPWNVDSLVFLDFDGVICDSLEECYQSSYLTVTDQSIGPNLPPLAPVDQSYRAAFWRCRPFIRSGEDYVVLHRLVAADHLPDSQAAFDRALQEIGQAALTDMKHRLYAAREALLRYHRDRWLAWNPLYPQLATLLKTLGKQATVFILSTKKAGFIQEILNFNAIDWPLERILYTGPQKKLALIETIFDYRPAVLIDDQIDHLDFTHPTCRCFVALWGYVLLDRLPAGTPALTLPQAVEYLSAGA